MYIFIAFHHTPESGIVQSCSKCLIWPNLYTVATPLYKAISSMWQFLFLCLLTSTCVYPARCDVLIYITILLISISLRPNSVRFSHLLESVCLSISIQPLTCFVLFVCSVLFCLWNSQYLCLFLSRFLENFEVQVTLFFFTYSLMS